MDLAISLLCVSLATRDLGDWQRFPPERLCRQNWEIADGYVRELEAAADVVGGQNADRFRDMACEARQRRSVWWELWWVTSKVNQETKEEHARTLRGFTGDRAYIVGEWPGPLPLHHFQRE